MTIQIPASEGQRPPQLRLSEADFDARRSEMAPSESLRRARLELRQRMISWASRVVLRLSELDLALEVASSDERPSPGGASAQRVVFGRDAPSRELLARWAHRQRLGDGDGGACLALAVDSSFVEVSMELRLGANVDAKNLGARLVQPTSSIELFNAFEALPEQFLVGSPGAPRMLQAQRVGAEQLSTLLSQGDAEGRALWVGWSVPREVAVTHSALLDEQLEDAIVALASIYKLIAWAPDNDLLAWGVSAGDGEEHEHEDRAWDRRVGHRRGRDRGSRVREEDARERKRVEPRPALRSGASAAPSHVKLGARVRVLAGPFVGKEGIVQELDGKGGARVMLGLLATRVAVRDLAVSSTGRDRPALRSSHRKLPARG